MTTPTKQSLIPLYRKTLEEILHGAYPDLQDVHDLTFKNSFGAVAGYVDGRIFCTSGNFGFALKLPRDVAELLVKQRGAKALKYFPRGHVKREYAVLPSEFLENAEELKEVIATSVTFVTSGLAGPE